MFFQKWMNKKKNRQFGTISVLINGNRQQSKFDRSDERNKPRTCREDILFIYLSCQSPPIERVLNILQSINENQTKVCVFFFNVTNNSKRFV